MKRKDKVEIAKLNTELEALNSRQTEINNYLENYPKCDDVSEFQGILDYYTPELDSIAAKIVEINKKVAFIASKYVGA